MDQLRVMADILPETEFKEIEAIKDELHDAWHKRQVFRTETEARVGVLNTFKYPTKAAKYWQSVREQTVHFDELVRLSFEMRRKKIELAQVEEKIEKAHGHEKALLEVDRDELLFNIKSGDQVAKDRVREVLQWSKIKKELDDGSFDTKNVNTHQAESLRASVSNRAKIATPDISTEEKLSIAGILHTLKEEEQKKVASKTK